MGRGWLWWRESDTPSTCPPNPPTPGVGLPEQVALRISGFLSPQATPPVHPGKAQTGPGTGPPFAHLDLRARSSWPGCFSCLLRTSTHFPRSQGRKLPLLRASE